MQLGLRSAIFASGEGELLCNGECFPLAALELVQMLVYLQVMVLFEDCYKILMYLIDSYKRGTILGKETTVVWV